MLYIVSSRRPKFFPRSRVVSTATHVEPERAAIEMTVAQFVAFNIATVLVTLAIAHTVVDEAQFGQWVTSVLASPFT